MRQPRRKERNDRKQQIKRVLKYVIPVFISSVIVCLPSFFSTSTYYDDELKLLQLKIRDKFRQSQNYGVYYKGIIRLLINNKEDKRRWLKALEFVDLVGPNMRVYNVCRANTRDWDPVKMRKSIALWHM